MRPRMVGSTAVCTRVWALTPVTTKPAPARKRHGKAIQNSVVAVKARSASESRSMCITRRSVSPSMPLRQTIQVPPSMAPKPAVATIQAKP